MQIDVLGPLRLEGGTSLRPRTRTVLAALASHSPELLSPDQLAEAVWQADPPISWSKQVQICIWDLRRALGASAVETVDGSYRLATGTIALDSEEFERLILRGRSYVESGSPELAAAAFSRALALWRGRPFADADEWLPVRNQATRLEELRRTTEEEHVAARLASGEHRDTVVLAETLTAAEPLRERRWALLALAQYRSGNQADALRSLRRARSVLVEQLGVDPGSEIVDLEASILRHDPALDTAAASEGSARCPYKGLVAYEHEDRDVFFGRDEDIVACVERLEHVRMLVLAGQSGCGKSSLVRAGIIPVLGHRHLAVVTLVPGSNPEMALSSALATVPGRPLVFVDQFEEVFASSLDPERCRRFCARLAAYSRDSAQVIVTVRSDQLGTMVAEPSLGRLVEQGLYSVSTLRGPQLRAAIEAPAAAAGLRLESGLVDLLVREIDDEPAALPLLSHALAETWANRVGRVLTVDGYRRTGEIRGAVTRSAEQLFESLPAHQQARLRSLLLRLVTATDDGEPVRVHLDVARIGDDPERARMVDLLVVTRLVTRDETSIQLAHEAVARAWPRMRAWLDDDAQGQRTMRHLSAAADGWAALGRPESELYRGARLEGALEWQAGAAEDLTSIEAEFLEASAAAAESETRSIAERVRQQSRSNRRLRWALLAAAVLLIAAVAGGLVAASQAREARAQGRTAAISALVGSATAQDGDRRDLAALLAIEAYRLRPDPASESALFGVFTSAPGIERTIHTDISLSVTSGDAAILADGHTAVTADDRAGVRLIDLDTGEVSTLPPLSDRSGWPVFAASADGTALAVGWRELFAPERGIFTVWDLASREQRFAPVDVPFRIGDIAISNDGSVVAVGGGIEMRALTFDGTDGTPLAEAALVTRPADAYNEVVTAALRFDGSDRLFVGSQGSVLRIIDPHTGEELERFAVPDESSNGAIALLDGGAEVLVTGAGAARVDLETGATVWVHPQFEQCNSFVVAEARGVFLCGEWSGRVIAFDLATGAELGARFDSQQGDVCGLAVSPDGTRLVETAACQSSAVTLVVWRLDGGDAVSRRLVDRDDTVDPYVGEFARDAPGSVVVEDVVRPDGPPRSWLLDPASGERHGTFDGVWGFVPTADDGVVTVAFDDGESATRLGLFDLARGAPAGPQIDPGIPVDRFWSDDELVVVTDSDGAIRMFEVATGRMVATIAPAENFTPLDVVFAPDAVYMLAIDQRTDPERWVIQRRDRSTGAVITETAEGNYRGMTTNGDIVIAATLSGQIVELDRTSLQPTGAAFPGTNGPTGELALDAAGTRLMVRADDDSLRFYDVATRTPLGDPIDTDDQNGSAALNSEGTLAAGVTGTGIVVWDLDPRAWIDGACRVAGRNLTREEWDRYIGDLAPYRETCPSATGVS